MHIITLATLFRSRNDREKISWQGAPAGPRAYATSLTSPVDSLSVSLTAVVSLKKTIPRCIANPHSLLLSENPAWTVSEKHLQMPDPENLGLALQPEQQQHRDKNPPLPGL